MDIKFVLKEHISPWNFHVIPWGLKNFKAGFNAFLLERVPYSGSEAYNFSIIFTYFCLKWVFSLARNTDQIEERLEKSESSISARQLLLLTTLENFDEISDKELDVTGGLSVIGEEHEDCPDCRLGTPIHIKLTSRDLCENELRKYGSDSSFSDSAVGSVESNQTIAQSLV